MKRILLSIVFVCCQLIAFSQDDGLYESRSGMYARGGINYAGTVGWDDDAATRTLGFMGGFGFTSLLDGPGRYSIHLGGEFSQQGLEIKDPVNAEDVSEMKLHYINIPLYLTYRPFQSYRDFYIGAGPQLGFRVGGHGVTKGGQTGSIVEEKFENTAWDAIGVVGFNFDNRGDLGIQFRYQHGLSKVFVDAPEVRHSVFQVSFIFPVGLLAELFPAEEQYYY